MVMSAMPSPTDHVIFSDSAGDAERSSVAVGGRRRGADRQYRHDDPCGQRDRAHRESNNRPACYSDFRRVIVPESMMAPLLVIALNVRLSPSISINMKACSVSLPNAVSGEPLRRSPARS